MLFMVKRKLLVCLVLAVKLLVPAQEVRGWGDCMQFCRCEDNTTVVMCEETDLTRVPEGKPGITKLHFSGTGITRVSAGDFNSYPAVMDLFFRDGIRPCRLQHLEPGAFDNLTSLKTLGLIGCYGLTTIPAGVFGMFQNLETLDLFRNGLTAVPDMSKFVNKNDGTNGALKELDLRNNKIEAIGKNAFSGVQIGTLNLEGNRIRSIESRAFSNSAIVEVRIKDNKELRRISPEAFLGMTGLEELDLSGTSIDSLPTMGIESVKKLFLKNTPSLKHFPTVLVFKGLVLAELTYPHHCCAFKNPDKQDPAAWKLQLERNKHDKHCLTTPATSFSSPVPHSDVVGAEGKDSGYIDEPILNNVTKCEPHNVIELRGSFFHSTVKIDNKPEEIGGDNFYNPERNVSCTPEPDAFNPCEDVMGYSWLRVTVWFVLLAALLGNSSVLVVLIKSHGKFTVPKFLMCNLAFADFLMGVYLILLASIDLHTLGEYFKYAVEWQNEGGCQAAGFLSVFSSEFSIFSLLIITLERWYAISHAIHLNKRLKMRHSVLLMMLACGFAIALAVLPLVGVSGYGHASICLPMKVENPIDVAYLVFILVLNGVVFLGICLCYLDMYWKVKKSATNARNNDTRIAKRMALLVLTNFACWAPIAFFGLTASAGEPLIDITNSKILLVFFYPLNSCANPFLYAILTKQFRKDVFMILGKNGLCVEKASKYRVTYTSRSLSQSRGNKDITIHGLHHRSESLFSHFPENNHGRKYSVSTPPKVHPSHGRPENGMFQSLSRSERIPEVTYRQHGNAGALPSTDTCCNSDIKRPPYIRSVSDYINFDPKRYHPVKNFPKEQKSIETYISNSTDTTCVSDYSHGTDDIWKIREHDAETEFSVDVDDFETEELHVTQKGTCQPPSQEMKTFAEHRTEAAVDSAIYCPLLERIPDDRRESDIRESSFE